MFRDVGVGSGDAAVVSHIDLGEAGDKGLALESLSNVRCVLRRASTEELT